MAENSLNTYDLNEERTPLVDENVQYPLDTPELAILLQCLGFTLDEYKRAERNKGPSEAVHSNLIHIEVTCARSGMTAILTKQTTSCKCPSNEDITNAQFWNVSGRDPSKQDRINVSNSSLLPSVVPSKSRIICDILNKVLGIINDTDNNQNEDASKLSGSRKTAYFLAGRRSCSLGTLTMDAPPEKGTISCQTTWEVDPRTSPPTRTSSPLPELCQSFNNMCIHSSKVKLLQILTKIKNLADDASELTSSQNTTFTKSGVIIKRVSNIKPLDDENFSTPIGAIHMGKSNQSISSTDRKAPRKIISKFNGENVSPASYSKTGSLRRKALGSSSASSKVTPVRIDTPRTHFGFTTANPKPKSATIQGAKPSQLDQAAPSSLLKSKPISKIPTSRMLKEK